MRFSPALKWLLIALLPLTLGWKLVVHANHPAEASDDEVQQHVAEFLVRESFRVAGSQTFFGGQRFIEATSGGACRILVVRSPVVGWDRDMIGRYAKAEDRFFVVFGGRVYDEQPTWLTVPNFLWARFRRELGLRVQTMPLLAVIADPSCEAERLPWALLKF